MSSNALGFSRIIFKRRLNVLLPILSAEETVFSNLLFKNSSSSSVTNKYAYRANARETSFAFKGTGQRSVLTWSGLLVNNRASENDKTYSSRN